MSAHRINGEPDFEALHALLPAMIEGYTKGKSMISMPSLPGGNRKSKVRQCIIDQKYFGGVFAEGDDLEVVKDVCPTCKRQLKKGWTAFVATDGRSLMIKPSAAVHPNYVGKIIKCSTEQMDILWQQAKKK